MRSDLALRGLYRAIVIIANSIEAYEPAATHKVSFGIQSEWCEQLDRVVRETVKSAPQLDKSANVIEGGLASSRPTIEYG